MPIKPSRPVAVEETVPSSPAVYVQPGDQDGSADHADQEWNDDCSPGVPDVPAEEAGEERQGYRNKDSDDDPCLVAAAAAVAHDAQYAPTASSGARLRPEELC